MLVTLTVTQGPHSGQVFTLSGHDTFLVGRSRRAHLRLPSKDRFFSRIHFLVEVNPPQYRLMDMGSRNGTYVNGERVEMIDLNHGDQIKAGRTVLRLEVSEETPASVPLVDLGSLPVVEPISLPLPPPPPPLPPPIECTGCRVCLAPLEGATVPEVPPFPGRVCATCCKLIQDQEQPIEGYHLVRQIGKGAMGVVSLAIRQADGSLVALKSILPAINGTPIQVERFLREADILRQLAHPNIVSFRDSGTSGGRIYFAMDYVRGKDAARLLRSEGPLSVARSVRLICQLLDALDYAHQHGFVHRDIKPSNMMVETQDQREVVKLGDFGLARVYQGSQLSGLTMTGDIGGTVAFMAPEQITNYREARPPVDQYGAAASLYNLLTRYFVYDLPVEFPRQLALVLNDPPVPILKRRPELPERLAAIIHKALAREPNERFSDVRAFRKALLPFVNGSS